MTQTLAPGQASQTGGVGVSCRGLVYIYRLEGFQSKGVLAAGPTQR